MFVDDEIYKLLETHFAHGKELADDERAKLWEWFSRNESKLSSHHGKHYYYKVYGCNIMYCYGKILKKCRQAAAKYCNEHPGRVVTIYKRIDGQEIPYIEYIGTKAGVVKIRRLI